MKYIRKYNESIDGLPHYTKIVSSFIDEVSGVFDDDKWGIIERTDERNGYYEFELKDYQTYSDIVTSKILEIFDSSTKNPFISIGVKRGDDTNPYNRDVLSKINEDINILNNIKRLFKNLEHLEIYTPFDYEYVGYDLLSLRIDFKWHLLKSL